MRTISTSSNALSRQASVSSQTSSPLAGAAVSAAMMATASADVMLHHRAAGAGETLHVYVDGEYYRAFDLRMGSTETYVHVGAEGWRTGGTVHAIDAYQAGANGRVIEHQSMLVTASSGVATRGVQAQGVEGSCESAAAWPAEVSVVEYRVSREGMPFGAWGRDYQEPASDGRDDGDYVVQMRFLDAAQRVLDLQTVAFQVRAGVVMHS